ncbi:MAG: hypothetical protein ACYC1B_08780, partial [Thermoleophilia bacterium]
MAFIWALVLIAAATTAFAGTGEITFVEADVELEADGSAVIIYTADWRVISGELHGFYFQTSEPVYMFADDSYAVDSAGNQYPLDITRLADDRYDIVLDGGRGVAAGSVTYIFWYQTSLAAAGYVAPTTADDGRDLVVFNWSPQQWDEAANQDHYTLRVLTPYTLPPGVDPRAHVEENQLVLTEQWVNRKFLIDYQRGPEDRLQLVFHRNDPGNLFKMETQFYLPAEWFDLPADVAAVKRPSASDIQQEHDYLRSDRWPWYLAGIGSLLSSFFAMVMGKQRSMVKAHAGLDEVRWENMDWTPPKLELSTFRVPGKVCKDLSRLEAAFYLEIPFKDIVSAMLQSLVNEGYLKVVSTTPFIINVIQVPDQNALDEYEQFFIGAVGNDGVLDQQELEELMAMAVKNVQQKAWDCDIDATQGYYRNLVNEFDREKRDAAARERGYQNQEYDNWFWWYHSMNPHNSRYAYDRDPWAYRSYLPVET